MKDLDICRDEVGEYYALDIGGTNFRVIHVTLSKDKGEVVSHQRCTLESSTLQSSEATYLAPLSSCWTFPVTCHGAVEDGDGRTMLSQMKLRVRQTQARELMCLCGHVAGLDVAGVVCKVHVEMEDNAIPEEYFTCHGDKLFDLLATALVDFAKRHGRCAVTCLSCRQHIDMLVLGHSTFSTPMKRCAPDLLMARQSWGQADPAGPTHRHSDDRRLPIGFCFSFPCTHTAIGEAVMVKLTKKFENEGMVGQDPAKGLQRALDRQKGNVRSPLLQALLHGCWRLLLLMLVCCGSLGGRTCFK